MKLFRLSRKVYDLPLQPRTVSNLLSNSKNLMKTFCNVDVLRKSDEFELDAQIIKLRP